MCSILCISFRVEYATPVGRELEKLLKIPINNFGNMLTVLNLEHFVPLLSLFDFEGRKAMSCYIADDVVETETYIPSIEQVLSTISDYGLISATSSGSY